MGDATSIILYAEFCMLMFACDSIVEMFTKICISPYVGKEGSCEILLKSHPKAKLGRLSGPWLEMIEESTME